mgnify:CR=1 FL=1
MIHGGLRFKEDELDISLASQGEAYADLRQVAVADPFPAFIIQLTFAIRPVDADVIFSLVYRTVLIVLFYLRKVPSNSIL